MTNFEEKVWKLDKSILYEILPFGGFFNERRVILVNKLESIFGIDWFAGKKILELGCGTGRIGRYFKQLGADVTFCDAREKILNTILLDDKDANCVVLNNETDWSLPNYYDLIIHFGLFYNLDNWQKDLVCTLKQGKFIAFEGGVSRFTKPFSAKITNPNYEYEHYGPFSKIGTLVSSVDVEKILEKQNKEWVRYDDIDLNGINYSYNWVEDDTDYERLSTNTVTLESWNEIPYVGGRRFWLIK